MWSMWPELRSQNALLWQRMVSQEKACAKTLLEATTCRKNSLLRLLKEGRMRLLGEADGRSEKKKGAGEATPWRPSYRVRSLFQEQWERLIVPRRKSTGENLLWSILFGCGGEDELGVGYCVCWGTSLEGMAADQSRSDVIWTREQWKDLKYIYEVKSRGVSGRPMGLRKKGVSRWQHAFGIQLSSAEWKEAQVSGQDYEPTVGYAEGFLSSSPLFPPWAVNCTYSIPGAGAESIGLLVLFQLLQSWRDTERLHVTV